LQGGGGVPPYQAMEGYWRSGSTGVAKSWMARSGLFQYISCCNPHYIERQGNSKVVTYKYQQTSSYKDITRSGDHPGTRKCPFLLIGACTICLGKRLQLLSATIRAWTKKSSRGLLPPSHTFDRFQPWPLVRYAYRYIRVSNVIDSFCKTCSN
jgi:hypothetical protein